MYKIPVHSRRHTCAYSNAVTVNQTHQSLADMHGSIYCSRLTLHQHISTSEGFSFKSIRLSRRHSKAVSSGNLFSSQKAIYFFFLSVDSPEQIKVLLLWVLTVFWLSITYIAMEESQILNSAAKRKAELWGTTLRWLNVVGSVTTFLISRYTGHGQALHQSAGSSIQRAARGCLFEFEN